MQTDASSAKGATDGGYARGSSNWRMSTSLAFLSSEERNSSYSSSSFLRDGLSPGRLPSRALDAWRRMCWAWRAFVAVSRLDASLLSCGEGESHSVLLMGALFPSYVGIYFRCSSWNPAIKAVRGAQGSLDKRCRWRLAIRGNSKAKNYASSRLRIYRCLQVPARIFLLCAQWS